MWNKDEGPSPFLSILFIIFAIWFFVFATFTESGTIKSYGHRGPIPMFHGDIYYLRIDIGKSGIVNIPLENPSDTTLYKFGDSWTGEVSPIEMMGF